MIDTIHLLPPDVGPRSNPVLFGVAAALAERLVLNLPLPSPAGIGQGAAPSAGAPQSPDTPTRPDCAQKVEREL